LSRLAAAHAPEGTPVSFAVGVYRDFARQGGLTFRTVLATQYSDCDCKPEGILTLDQIEAAIERIEDGSYGRCEECGEEIPKSRLEAIPYAAECVRCASQEEESNETIMK
jgi:hypothetical protein